MSAPPQKGLRTRAIQLKNLKPDPFIASTCNWQTPSHQTQRRHRLQAKPREQPDGGLLDQLVFGAGAGVHFNK